MHAFLCPLPRPQAPPLPDWAPAALARCRPTGLAVRFLGSMGAAPSSPSKAPAPSPPADGVKLLPHPGPEEAPMKTGRAWAGEADGSSPPLPASRPPPAGELQLMIFTVTTASSRWSGRCLANSTAGPQPAWILSRGQICVLPFNQHMSHCQQSSPSAPPGDLLPVRKDCGLMSHAPATEQVTWGGKVFYSVCTELVERQACMGQRGLCAETAWALAACSGFSSPGSQSHRK